MCAASGLAIRTVTQSGYSMRYSIPYQGAAAASRTATASTLFGMWAVGSSVR